LTTAWLVVKSTWFDQPPASADCTSTPNDLTGTPDHLTGTTDDLMGF
jgi:hypothetical protein